MPKKKTKESRQFDRLCIAITQVEGKKVQVSIGNVREVLSILSDIAYLSPVELISLLYENGKRREGL